jgi:hypothetical protein
MTSTLEENADNESWGIRDFMISFSPCPEGCSVCTEATLTSCTLWTIQSSSWVSLTSITAAGWTVTGAPSGTTTCAGVEIFGGYNLFGEGAIA